MADAIRSVASHFVAVRQSRRDVSRYRFRDSLAMGARVMTFERANMEMLAALDSNELAADCAAELCRQPPLFGVYSYDARDVKVAHLVPLRPA